VSGDGALYGQRIHHAAALASTCREKSDIPAQDVAMRQVAKYTRLDGFPFRVVHDLTVNRPYGRHVVYVGERRIGAQLSFPSESDCRRMESPPPPSEPYEKRLTLEQRQALGMLVNPNSQAAGTAKSIRTKRARALERGRVIHQSIYRKHRQ
jgi:hypothetical protein